MSSNSEKFVVLHIEGGLGKNIAATALISPLKKKYPDRKLVIVASWVMVFLNDPRVYRTYTLGSTHHFYDTYINGKDTIVFRREPYHENDHIMKKTSLHETWIKMYGLEYDKETVNPQIFMNFAQKSTTQNWKRNKPIFLIQTGGGPFNPQHSNLSYTWTRDMPPMFASEISKLMSRTHHVIQVSRERGYTIDGVEVVNKPINIFELFSLVLASDKRLLIDSCLQHAAAAFKLKSTVLWVGTHPEMFGYDIHHNIVANKLTYDTQKIDSYLFDYDFNGLLHQCPYAQQKDMFNFQDIIDSLNISL